MTKKLNFAKTAAPKSSSFEEIERASNAVIERVCAERGIGRAVFIRWAQRQIKRMTRRNREGAA